MNEEKGRKRVIKKMRIKIKKNELKFQSTK